MLRGRPLAPLEASASPPQEIKTFIDDTLDRRSRDRMLEHLDHCRICVKLLADEVREKRAKKIQ